MRLCSILPTHKKIWQSLIKFIFQMTFVTWYVFRKSATQNSQFHCSFGICLFQGSQLFSEICKLISDWLMTRNITEQELQRALSDPLYMGLNEKKNRVSFRSLILIKLGMALEYVHKSVGKLLLSISYLYFFVDIRRKQKWSSFVTFILFSLFFVNSPRLQRWATTVTPSSWWNLRGRMMFCEAAFPWLPSTSLTPS